MRSKKDVSAIVSGWGVGMSVLTKLMEKGKQRGLSDEDFYRLAQSEGDPTLEKFVDAMVAASKLEVWKTIKLGTGLKTADDFRKAIKSSRMDIGNWASDILGKPAFTVAAEETEIDLVKVTVGEFGFKQGTRRDQIYARAKELGLELCPAEVGPQLRLQYRDQPMDEWLLMAMEPITDSGGSPGVFNVRHGDNGLWLYGYDAYPGHFWNTAYQWLFVRPRK